MGAERPIPFGCLMLPTRLPGWSVAYPKLFYARAWFTIIGGMAQSLPIANCHTLLVLGGGLLEGSSMAGLHKTAQGGSLDFSVRVSKVLVQFPSRRSSIAIRHGQSRGA